MKTFVKLTSIMLAILLLTGCNTTTDVRVSTPALNVGTLASGWLETDDPQFLRCRMTSGCTMAETKDGFYLTRNQILYYADKADLGNWVKVCAKPNCLHIPEPGCDAFVVGEFVLQDGRIYFTASAELYPELCGADKRGSVLLSIAPDGTNRTLAYLVEEAMLPDGGTERTCILPSGLLSCVSGLEKDGRYLNRIYLTNGDGLHCLYQKKADSAASLTGISARLYAGLFGDDAVYTDMIDEAPGMYRIEQNAIRQLKIDSFSSLDGAYLSDHILRLKRDAGYFDIDLNTGQETFLADAQLEYSGAMILLPNCILESTLLGNTSLLHRDKVNAHQMRLFDGEMWRDVSVPDALQAIPDTEFLYPLAVASDRIFLTGPDSALYQIILNTQQLHLERIAVIGA